MRNQALSNLINERKDQFTWLESFVVKLLKTFPTTNVDKNTLHSLITNIESEINTLSSKEDPERKEALFDVVSGLFLHFWWQIRWDSKKKWRKSWKTEYSEVAYSHDERTNCCEKLLYYIIYLGILFTNGCINSKWLSKILTIIYIFPSYDDLICTSLLQIRNLEETHNTVYMAILKHVLCSQTVENISEPNTYVKILLLFRRLKEHTKDKSTLCAIKSSASSIAAPPNTIQWLSALKVHLSLETCDNFAEFLLSKKCSKSVVLELCQIVTGILDLQENAAWDILANKILNKKDKTSQKSCMLKQSNTPQLMAKSSSLLLESKTKSANSKVKIKLNHKMLTGFNTPDILNKNSTIKNIKSLLKDQLLKHNLKSTVPLNNLMENNNEKSPDCVQEVDDRQNLQYELTNDIHEENNTELIDIDLNGLSPSICVDETTSCTLEDLIDLIAQENNNTTQTAFIKDSNCAIEVETFNFKSPSRISKTQSESATFDASKNSLLTACNDNNSNSGNTLLYENQSFATKTSKNVNSAKSLPFECQPFSPIPHTPNNNKPVNQTIYDDRITIVKGKNTAHCNIDCKIVADCNKKCSSVREAASLIKVVINVNCDVPEDGFNHKNDMFGNLNKTNGDVSSSLNSLKYNNSFCAVSVPEMPKLFPIYPDTNNQIRSIDAIETPPDSELEASTSSLLRDNTSFLYIATGKINGSSTPKDMGNAFSENQLTATSDSKTPNTSECESAIEWNLENTNLTSSLSLLGSLQNSTPDLVLQQLNARQLSTPIKKGKNTPSTSKHFSKAVSFRNNPNIYSDEKFSDDSTASCLSEVSSTDLELGGSSTTSCKRKKKKVSKKNPVKIARRMKPAPSTSKSKPKILHSVPSNTPPRYNLRSRESITKPTRLELYFP